MDLWIFGKCLETHLDLRMLHAFPRFSTMDEDPEPECSVVAAVTVSHGSQVRVSCFLKLMQTQRVRENY